jgi:hypothetical protein
VKKIVSILVLGLLMLSLGGYRLILTCMETASDRAFEASLYENSYDESMLLHIKVPASTPYGANTAEFENASGNIDINGVTYHFVKRRFYRDSLELLCVPNIEKAGIRNAREVFLGLANDYAVTKSTQNIPNQPQALKFSLSDFTGDHSFSWQFRDVTPVQTLAGHSNDHLAAGYEKDIDHPPVTAG